MDTGKIDSQAEGLLKGFSKLERKERLQKLLELGFLSKEDVEFFQSSKTLPEDMAEHFIENVLGYFQMPLGVATNFVIDGVDQVIPMAVEETSIIAAASKTAKWIQHHGHIETESIGQEIIGQVQISKLKNKKNFEEVVKVNAARWVKELNENVAQGMVQRGGGTKSIKARVLERPDGDFMGVVHIYADPCDAMGANIMNQMCEYLKTPLEKETQETVTMCILSNLVDSKLTKARITLKNIDPDLAYKIQEASIFAETDSYRAATNNKGVLNGIDPILIATGNDWRAVEAGIHAYAARDGKYRSITKWRADGSTLIGEFIAPLIVGVVGGVTALHPTAKMSLRMLKVKSAERLSRICAAVGLTQNLGALRALTTVGIIEGHMKLHIRNLLLGAGANEDEMPLVQGKMEELLMQNRRISLSHAMEVLRDHRNKHAQSSTGNHQQPTL